MAVTPAKHPPSIYAIRNPYLCVNALPIAVPNPLPEYWQMKFLQWKNSILGSKIPAPKMAPVRIPLREANIPGGAADAQ